MAISRDYIFKSRSSSLGREAQRGMTRRFDVESVVLSNNQIVPNCHVVRFPVRNMEQKFVDQAVPVPRHQILQVCNQFLLAVIPLRSKFTKVTAEES